jgi:uncharacterized protein (DUF3084 family)
MREGGDRRKELKHEIHRLGEELRRRDEEINALRSTAHDHQSEVEHFAEELRRRDEQIAQHETELATLREAGAAADAAIAELGRTVDERSARLETVTRRREAQVVRFIGRVREREQRLAVMAGAQDEQPEPEPAHAHVLYVQLADRYVLVECEGQAPSAGSTLQRADVSGRPLVVERVGPSPLPGDARRCAFAYEAPPAAEEAEAAA